MDGLYTGNSELQVQARGVFINMYSNIYYGISDIFCFMIFFLNIFCMMRYS